MRPIGIPNIVKHCCIAIYRDGGISSRSQKDRFKQALTIARARLSSYGFITISGQKLSDPVGLTAKGQKAEMRHKREGRSKTVLFDTLYEQFDIDGSKAAAAKKAKEEAQRLQEKINEAKPTPTTTGKQPPKKTRAKVTKGKVLK